MTMIEVKTADLIGPALDWAVYLADSGIESMAIGDYSVDWDQGGRLIDDHKICIICLRSDDPAIKRIGGGCWSAKLRDADHDYSQLSPTALIAACRALVREKLGETVCIPAELVES